MGLLQNKVYEIIEEEISGLREDKITIYVEHPVPLEPPAEEMMPPPMPLPLTTKVSQLIEIQSVRLLGLSLTKIVRSRMFACDT